MRADTGSAPATVAAEPLDLAGPDLLADPYPAYAALRAGGGLHRSERWDAYLVTSYEPCHAVFSDDRFDPAGQPFLRMLQADILRGAASWRTPPAPALDTAYAEQRIAGRRTTGRALSTGFVDSLWPRFAADCRTAAAAVAEAAQVGPVDLVADYAIPLTTGLLADLMAVPPADLPVFRVWAESSYHPDTDEAAKREIVRGVRHLLAEQAVGRLKHPADDFVGYLAANPGALPGERPGLTAHLEFVLGTGLMISLVTHQGLVLSFSTLLHSLLRRPDQYALLRRTPALLPGAVEEGLRFDPSTQALGRLARTEVTLGEVTIPANGLVVCFVGSANRDPGLWADPDTFDLTRDSRGTSRHLTFGLGATSCLGASMSRRALGHLLGALLDRAAAMAPAPGAERFREFMTRGFTRLPVRLEAERGVGSR